MNELGQLTQVMEPHPGTGKPAYEIDYSYDPLGNLLHSDQWGGASGNAGDRVRSSIYDGASRLLTATLPESGTMGAQNLCAPRINAPTEQVTVHDSLSLAQVSENLGSAVQAVSSFITAPPNPGCLASAAGRGAVYGGLTGAGPGGIGGGAEAAFLLQGSVQSPGALAGASERGLLRSTGWPAAASPIGFISCYQGGGGGTSAGSANQQVQRGQAPKSVIRVDKARAPFEQDNVHFKDGTALKRDGSWKHGSRQLTNPEK